MNKSIVVFLILINIITYECLSHKARKQELTNLCFNISTKQIMPEKIGAQFAEYIRNIKDDQTPIILGAFVGLLLAPIIAPVFAAAGLAGAAATSSGLATLGGGSLAAGGFGMLGGLLTVSLAGGLFGYSYSAVSQDFDIFMKHRNNIYSDYIILGNFKIETVFNYQNKHNYIYGETIIFMNNVKIFDGDAYCDEKGCSLIGDFY